MITDSQAIILTSQRRHGFNDKGWDVYDDLTSTIGVRASSVYKGATSSRDDKGGQKGLRLPFDLEAYIFTRAQFSATRRAHEKRDDEKVRTVSEEERVVGTRR